MSNWKLIQEIAHYTAGGRSFENEESSKLTPNELDRLALMIYSHDREEYNMGITKQQFMDIAGSLLEDVPGMESQPAMKKALTALLQFYQKKYKKNLR